MIKKSLILFFVTFSLIANAQPKKRKKVLETKPITEIVTDTISKEATKQETKPQYRVSEEAKEKMKTTKVIPIGTNVFVQMVFNSVVQVVRSGAPDMAMVRNEDNVVTVQALTEGVNSNITVKTADGLYYSYKIVSDENEDIPLFYEVPISDAVNAQSKLIEDSKKKIVEKMSVQEVTQTIYNYDGYIKNRNKANYKDIYITIKGVYIDKGKLFFLFNIANKSTIDYKVERFQFFTMPIHKGKKRIENEEKEYLPLFYYKSLTEIKAKTEEVVVIVFDKFTLNDQKKMQVTMSEDGGERTVKLDIDTEKILKARQI